MVLWNCLKHSRWTKLIPRCYGSIFVQFSTKKLVKIYENSFKVHPNFGKLFLKSHCNCSILPADTQLYPDADHAKIIYWSTPGKSDSSINVELPGKKDLIKLETFPSCDESRCEIFIPMKYDIEANLDGTANLSIQNVESDNINITSSKGLITTKNIKTEEMSISVDDGSVTLDGAFQGNLFINAKNIMLKAKRLQGTLLCVQADYFETDIESSYMNNGTIFAKSGKLYIKNLHGSTDLHLSKGDLYINGLHGRLQSIVNEGTVEVHVSEITDLSLIELSSGSLQLSFAELSDKSVTVSSPVLELSPEVEAHGSKFEEKGKFKFSTTFQSAPLLHANVGSGNLKLFIKDWFASLGIEKSR